MAERIFLVHVIIVCSLGSAIERLQVGFQYGLALAFRRLFIEWLDWFLRTSLVGNGEGGPIIYGSFNLNVLIRIEMHSQVKRVQPLSQGQGPREAACL